VGSLVSQGEIVACPSEGQTLAAEDAGLVIPVIEVAEGENVDLVTGCLEGAFVQVNVGRDAADIWFVGIRHHSDSHGAMLRQGKKSVKA